MPSALEKRKFLQESSTAPKPKSEGFPSNLQARAQPCRDGAEGSTFPVSLRPLGAVRLQDFTQCLAIPAHSLLQNTLPLSALPEGPRLGPGRAGTQFPAPRRSQCPWDMLSPSPHAVGARDANPAWDAWNSVRDSVRSGTKIPHGNRNPLPWARQSFLLEPGDAPAPPGGRDGTAGTAQGWQQGGKSPGSRQDPISSVPCSTCGSNSHPAPEITAE